MAEYISTYPITFSGGPRKGETVLAGEPVEFPHLTASEIARLIEMGAVMKREDFTLDLIPGITPAQVKELLNRRILTAAEVAAAPRSVIAGYLRLSAERAAELQEAAATVNQPKQARKKAGQEE